MLRAPPRVCQDSPALLAPEEHHEVCQVYRQWPIKSLRRQSKRSYLSPGHPLSPNEVSPVKDRGEGAYRSESVSDSPSAMNGLTLAHSECPGAASAPTAPIEPVKKDGPKKSSLAWEMLNPLKDRSSSSWSTEGIDRDVSLSAAVGSCWHCCLRWRLLLWEPLSRLLHWAEAGGGGRRKRVGEWSSATGEGLLATLLFQAGWLKGCCSWCCHEVEARLWLPTEGVPTDRATGRPSRGSFFSREQSEHMISPAEHIFTSFSSFTSSGLSLSSLSSLLWSGLYGGAG